MNPNTRRSLLVALVVGVAVAAAGVWWLSRGDGDEPPAQTPPPVPVPVEGIDLPKGAIPENTRKPADPR